MHKPSILEKHDEIDEPKELFQNHNKMDNFQQLNIEGRGA